MKYIRTKDGRIIDLTSKQVSSYEIIDDKTAVDEYGEESGFICVYYFNCDIGEHIEYDDKGGRSMDNWYLKDILKQADTIEELCDEFVIVCEDSSLNTSFKKLKEARIAGSYFECNHEYYGAIWCEFGLKYVARLNNEGKLELI